MRAPIRWLALGLLALVLAGCGEPKKKRREESGEAPGSSGGPGPVESYRLRAMTSEARNTLGALSRAAIASFERETVGADLDAVGKHEVCKSALPVPASVPKGPEPHEVQPKDFDTGDATSGWRCLKFTMTQPIHYQYELRSAPPWKGTSRGGPDPGPGGFEASAEGDLDGDGKTSLFVLVGKQKDGALLVSTQVFVVDELE